MQAAPAGQGCGTEAPPPAGRVDGRDPLDNMPAVPHAVGEPDLNHTPLASRGCLQRNCAKGSLHHTGGALNRQGSVIHGLESNAFPPLPCGQCASGLAPVQPGATRCIGSGLCCCTSQAAKNGACRMHTAPPLHPTKIFEPLHRTDEMGCGALKHATADAASTSASPS